MSAPAAALAGFEVLIGTWTTEAVHPSIDAVVRGAVTFEWLAGGHFLLQRSRNDHEMFPDSISVIGAAAAGGAVLMEYFDSRGVRRTYFASMEGGTLRIWRDDPEFPQRFAATPEETGFVGLWQTGTPEGWVDDLRVSYRR